MKVNIDKILIACGFIGPIIFFLTVYFLFPLFYPGYDWVNQGISKLGALNSPIKTVANVFGFSLLGIFIMLFAFGLFRSKELNLGGKIGAFFIFVTGILMYLTGIFSLSGASGLYSKLDILHATVADYQFPILAVGFIVFAFSVLGHKKLRFLTPVILVLGITTLYLAYTFYFNYQGLQNPGIRQRAAIGLPYFIVMIIAITLYKVQFKKFI